jgi:hypothetical protein
MASKKLKKLAKAALIGGALYAGAKGLGKRRLSKAVSGTDDAGLGVSHFKDYITKKPKVTPTVDEGIWGSPWGAKGGGIAKRGMGAAFKKGGHVKSMGIAKRGGGAAKR